MEEAGIVAHLAKSGRLILKINRPHEPGTILLNHEGKRVARIVELIGPVSSPYASAVSLTGKVQQTPGEKIYVSGSDRRYAN